MLDTFPTFPHLEIHDEPTAIRVYGSWAAICATLVTLDLVHAVDERVNQLRFTIGGEASGHATREAGSVLITIVDRGATAAKAALYQALCDTLDNHIQMVINHEVPVVLVCRSQQSPAHCRR